MHLKAHNGYGGWINMARQLTEKQQKLLAVLFDEAGGDLVTPKKS